MKKIRSIAIVTLLVATFAVGCGKESKVEAPVSNTEPTNSVETTNAEATVTEAVTNTEVTATPEVTESVSEEENAPYTYTDVAGRSITMEAKPTRIAVDYLPLWETLLLLDVTPIASTSVENYLATWDPFQGVEMGEITEIGTSEVNFELLTELEPELILTQVYDLSKLDVTNYEQIAPVAVFGPETKMDWRLSLREVGKAIGKEDKAEEVIAEVDKTLADARGKLQEAYKGQTVMQISLMGEDRYFIAYRPDLYDTETGLGLQLPEGYTTNENYEQITMEAIVEMNPDHIFVNVFDADVAIYDELSNNSVWSSLKAVKEGHVYMLDGSGHACSALSTMHTVNFMIDTLLANQ